MNFNDRLFPEKYTVKDHISNTKLEKGDHFYIQRRHKDLFSLGQTHLKCVRNMGDYNHLLFCK